MTSFLTAFVAIAVALTSVAHAEDKEWARAAYEQATQHYDLGEYKEALEAFKDAYRNFEDPAFLFNIAQCHRQLGDNAQAVREYRMYLLKLPDAPNRDAVGDLITRLEKSLAEPSTQTAPLVQPALAITTPPPRPVYKRRWFVWTAAGGAVAIALTVGLAVGLTQPTTPNAKSDFGTVKF